MEPGEKDRIREIVRRRMDRISRSHAGSTVFDFVISEASISEKHRDVDITPREIFGLSETLSKNDPQFFARYKAWEAGLTTSGW